MVSVIHRLVRCQSTAGQSQPVLWGALTQLFGVKLGEGMQGQSQRVFDHAHLAFACNGLRAATWFPIRTALKHPTMLKDVDILGRDDPASAHTNTPDP